MPHDFYPPLWLPFVAFGKFSLSPVPAFDGASNGKSTKIIDKVPSRATIRGLGTTEKRANDSQTSVSNKKTKDDTATRLMVAVIGMETNMTTMVRMEEQKHATWMRDNEIRDLKDQIAEAREDGFDTIIPQLKAKLTEVRGRSLEHWIPKKSATEASTTSSLPVSAESNIPCTPSISSSSAENSGTNNNSIYS